MNNNSLNDGDIRNARARDIDIIQHRGNFMVVSIWIVLIASVFIIILFKNYMYEEDIILLFFIIRLCVCNI